MVEARFMFPKSLGLSLLCALALLAGCASMVSTDAERKMGDDAAREIESQMGFMPESELTAVQVENNGVELAWVVHGGRVYLVSGVAPLESFESHRSLFRKAAESFRSPTAAELDRIEVQRLRMIAATGATSMESLPA